MTDHNDTIEAAMAEDDAAQASIEEAQVIAARIVADAIDGNPGAEAVLRRNENARNLFSSYAEGVLPALLVRLDGLGMSSDEAVDDIAEPLTTDVLKHVVGEAVVAELARAAGQLPAGSVHQYVTPAPGTEVPAPVHGL